MRPSLFLVALAALCAGCRSDGGLDRQDCGRGMAFSTNRVASRFEYDCRRTYYLLSSIPSALESSLTEGTDRVRDTYYLYLENHEAR